VVKLRDGVFKIEALTVDTNKKELTAPGFLNIDVTTLEFVANTRGGAKAYESAITVLSDAVTFNTALLLLGLDPAHAQKPTKHFDTKTPAGDPLEIWVEWMHRAGRGRVSIEELLFDERTKRPMAPASWVYTGSTFSNGRFMAETDGVLIGFVHSPAPVIENRGPGAVNAYGSIVLNKRLQMDRGGSVTLIIKALPVAKGSH
jgi:hypothetical protein